LEVFDDSKTIKTIAFRSKSKRKLNLFHVAVGLANDVEVCSGKLTAPRQAEVATQSER
jgi:hypothetical protein